MELSGEYGHVREDFVLGPAHEKVGRVARTNAFEVMFRVRY